MWCGRKNCLNRSDYSVEWKNRNENKDKVKDNDDTSTGSSNEFKIALAAMTSADDFAALQEQFEQLKD